MPLSHISLCQLYLTTFNLLFTSTLPIITAVLDQNLRPAVLRAYPSLYEVVCDAGPVQLGDGRQGRRDMVYKGRFWTYIAEAYYFAVITFFTAYFAYLHQWQTSMLGIGTTSLHAMDMLCLTCAVYYINVLSMNLYVVGYTKTWTRIHLFFIALRCEFASAFRTHTTQPRIALPLIHYIRLRRRPRAALPQSVLRVPGCFAISYPALMRHRTRPARRSSGFRCC